MKTMIKDLKNASKDELVKQIIGMDIYIHRIENLYRSYKNVMLDMQDAGEFEVEDTTPEEEKTNKKDVMIS